MKDKSDYDDQSKLPEQEPDPTKGPKDPVLHERRRQVILHLLQEVPHAWAGPTAAMQEVIRYLNVADDGWLYDEFHDAHDLDAIIAQKEAEEAEEDRELRDECDHEDEEDRDHQNGEELKQMLSDIQQMQSDRMQVLSDIQQMQSDRMQVLSDIQQMHSDIRLRLHAMQTTLRQGSA